MIAAFQSARRVYLDTAPFIYFMEENKDFSPLIDPLIRAIDRGDKSCFSSYITLLEILVKPLEQKRDDLAARYRTLLLDTASLELVPLEQSVAEEAARLRAEHRLKIADAIQLATAIHSGADLFVTNDKELRDFPEIQVLVLSDHL